MKLSVKNLETAMLGILIIVLLFIAYTAIIPTGQSAGDELTDSGTCSKAGGVYNSSTSVCQNQTGSTYTAVDYQDIPLGSLFSGTGGVIFVVVMAALLVLIVRSALPQKKK